MAEVQFSSLVEMQEKSCAQYARNRLFGTKIDGSYQWITYAQFADRVNRCRAALHALGVRKDSKVAAISNNRIEWAVGAYATYSLGAHYVPMYEAQLEKDWKYILEDSGAHVVFAATEEIYDTVRTFPEEIETLHHVICFDADSTAEHSFAHHLEVGGASPVDSLQPTPEDVAGLIYTSGTTGEPKGVVLSHGNIVSNVNAVHDHFPMTDQDVSLSFLPWAHSFGQTCELHCLLSMGAAIGLAESVQTLLVNLGEVRPTLLFSVPRVFNRIYDGLRKKMADESAAKKMLFDKGLEVAQRRRELDDKGQKSFLVDAQYGFFDKLIFSKVRERFGGRLKYAFSGGAALSAEVAKFIDDMGIVVYEGYGLTETSPIATANRPGEKRIGSVGKPINGVSVYILDKSDERCEVGQDGEIVVVGPNVMQGYHNRPDATDEVIFELDGERAFRTGDMGHIDEDGFVHITGRIKEQYKLENGKYVVPAPLEEKLKLSGFINQVCIYGMNRPYNIALVVPDEEALIKWAKSEGISFSSLDDLVDDERVYAKIGDELAEYGDDFKGYEKPRKWALITEEFTPENEMLTPTLKLKRRNVIEAYKDTIESLYEDS